MVPSRPRPFVLDSRQPLLSPSLRDPAARRRLRSESPRDLSCAIFAPPFHQRRQPWHRRPQSPSTSVPSSYVAAFRRAPLPSKTYSRRFSTPSSHSSSACGVLCLITAPRCCCSSSYYDHSAAQACTCRVVPSVRDVLPRCTMTAKPRFAAMEAKSNSTGKIMPASPSNAAPMHNRWSLGLVCLPSANSALFNNSSTSKPETNIETER
jgi:hypothetical protein